MQGMIVTSIRTVQTELQKSLKIELHNELRQELSKSGLHTTARPFIPLTESGSSPGVDGHTDTSETVTGQVDNCIPSTPARSTAATLQKQPHVMVKRPGMHSLEILAWINRCNGSDKAAYVAITLRGPATMALTNELPDQNFLTSAKTTLY